MLIGVILIVIISFLLNYSEFPLLYYIENGVNAVMVRATLAELQAETCLTFKEIPGTIETKSGIIFYKGNGCYSQLGKQGIKTWQIVSLGDECMRIQKIQHEILHALGFFHEHSRIDRNEHLYIFPKNIRRGYRDDSQL
uniref:Metalloendopeptidase n=1 Tax=Strongyloides papillosus TaxID=174720 RepID=A0A0N5C9A0_STREA